MVGYLPGGLSTADVLFTATRSMIKARNESMMLFIDLAVQHRYCEYEYLITAGSLDTYM